MAEKKAKKPEAEKLTEAELREGAKRIVLAIVRDAVVRDAAEIYFSPMYPEVMFVAWSGEEKGAGTIAKDVYPYVVAELKEIARLDPEPKTEDQAGLCVIGDQNSAANILLTVTKTKDGEAVSMRRE